MPYSPPASWSAGQLVGATDLNTQLRDNFLSIAGTTGALTSAGVLTVSSGGANITGTVAVTGAVTVSAGVAIAGGLSVSSGIAGTLSTAAQGNITSVGTLTGLTVSGTVAFSSVINIGSTFAAQSGLNLPNSGYAVAWRNGANSGDNFIATDSGNRLVLSGFVAGTAVTFSGSSTTSAQCVFNGTTYRIPLIV